MHCMHVFSSHLQALFDDVNGREQDASGCLLQQTCEHVSSNAMAGGPQRLSRRLACLNAQSGILGLCCALEPPV